MLSPDVAERFRSESASPNPSLELIRAYADAELQLETERLARALGPGPDEAFAPPEDVDFEPPEPMAPREAEGGADVISSRPCAPPVWPRTRFPSSRLLHE